MEERMSLDAVFSALRFAAERHQAQRRKGGREIPYINHPIDVATLLVTVAGVTDPDLLAAALLHDTVEDTDTTLDELSLLFGEHVASIVAEVTDNCDLPSDERKRIQEVEAPFKSHPARLIRIADKTSNVSDIAIHPPPAWSVERRRSYFEWAARVVGAMRGTNAPLEAAFDAALAKARASIA
ncbi:MAG: Metal dependent phosphohydrolase [Gemmatimonadetes bacterium]|nr:Metal dependent phosphohydrolase [Gemmatimonadota bacterium]